jgi:chemotaxis protein MotB
MARRGGKKRAAEEEHENAERWLLTYADMITLLMVLFIVLFAIGQVDQKKFEKLHDGLAQSFGESSVLDGGAGMLDGSAVQADAPDESQMGTQVLARQDETTLAAQAAVEAAKKEAEANRALEATITAALAKKGLEKAVEFQVIDQRGLSVNIVTDHILFDLGEATLRPKGVEVLSALAPVLKKLPNQLVVEGHTDSQPISDARFASNWELSTARATTVLQYLLKRGVNPSIVSAAGYADQRPLVPGKSSASNARNRRVAIVIVADPATATVTPDVTAATQQTTSGG